jgi:hypothetical protein
MIAYCQPQASLPNPPGRFFPAEWHFVTKLGPQVSSFPVPILGVNNQDKCVSLQPSVYKELDLA